MLIDTHAHLDQEDFDPDRPNVIERARQAGVETMVAIGTTADSSRVCLDLAESEPGIFAAVGIHPNHAAEALEGDWDQIVSLAEHPRAVALGETGLDRHWNYTPFDIQQDYFDRHLRLAHQCGLPVVIHTRDCQPDMLAMLRDAHASRGPICGIMHSFAGDEAFAMECLEMGLFISFSGMVTYKKNSSLRACAATIPSGQILLETDSPYLSPEPVRGQRRNEPAHLAHTARCLAEVRGVSLEELAAQTTANARRLFSRMMP